MAPHLHLLLMSWRLDLHLNGEPASMLRVNQVEAV